MFNVQADLQISSRFRMPLFYKLKLDQPRFSFEEKPIGIEQQTEIHEIPEQVTIMIMINLFILTRVHLSISHWPTRQDPSRVAPPTDRPHGQSVRLQWTIGRQPATCAGERHAPNPTRSPSSPTPFWLVLAPGSRTDGVSRKNAFYGAYLPHWRQTRSLKGRSDTSPSPPQSVMSCCWGRLIFVELSVETRDDLHYN